MIATRTDGSATGLFRHSAATMRTMDDLNGLGFAFADVQLSEAQCEYVLASLPAPDQRGGLHRLLNISADAARAHECLPVSATTREDLGCK